ncbi:MAG: hypothetical protein WC621_01565 [Patescibacteria group bacterium]
MYRKVIYFSILIIILLLGLTSYSWYWRRAAVRAGQAAAANLAVPDNSIKTGMSKVRQWERLVEADPPRINKSFDAEFTTGELAAIIKDSEKGKTNPTFAPDSVSVALVEHRILLSGIVRQPFYHPLSVEMTAAVKAGRLELEIISVKAGLVPLSPKLVYNLADEIFGNRWQAEINRSSFNWTDLVIGDDSVYVGGNTTGKSYQ